MASGIAACDDELVVEGKKLGMREFFVSSAVLWLPLPVCSAARARGKYPLARATEAKKSKQTKLTPIDASLSYQANREHVWMSI